MYRLTVVSGPGRGTVFRINEGENSVGRQLGNTVVLPSTQVSKRHCVLVASNGKVLVQDQGSSNGTYVNGSLASSKQLKSGDRIGIGEYVLELSAARPALPAAPGANVVSIASGLPVTANPMQDAGSAHVSGFNDFSSSGGTTQASDGPPKDLIGKAFWAFDNYVMPYFYGLNLKSQWRVICGVIFGGFVVVNLLVSVQPLLEGNTQIILRESMRRASFMAKVIADKNTAALANGNETRTEIGLPGHSDVRESISDGIQLAVLTDLDLRILAPAQRINQYLLTGEEAKIGKKLAKLYRDGKEGGYQTALGESSVVAVEPVKVFRGGKNVVIAMAIVSLDVSTAVMGMGEVGLIYSQVLIITALVGMLALFIMYRLTLKPFQILGEDMDKALKGEITQVTHEFKLEELNPLWDLINSAIQRIPRGNSDLSSSAQQEANPEQFVGPVQATAEATGAAVAVCGPDRRVLFMSSAFERVTGIRADSAIGQDFSNLGTDQSTGAMVQELFDRATPGGEPATDDKEFGGVQYQLYAAGFGTASDTAPRAYVLTIVSKGDS